jgi:hypothetical protein
MKNLGVAVLTAAALLVAVPLSAQGVGQAVVTVLPKDAGQPVSPNVAQADLAVKVNGKNAKVVRWAPYATPNDQIELVLLIDSGARSSLGQQLDDMAQFVKGLPPNVKAAIAYMANGQARFAGPLTSDHEAVLANLHLPSGPAGISASAYFCLSDLAKNWPGQDAAARREVVMVTDGVDNYEPRYNPEDPYVQAAIRDAVKARLIVYSIYWRSRGREDQNGVIYNAGQNLLAQVADATGGKSFWQGNGNPVSFAPYFEELTRRLRNQWELGFTAPFSGKPGVAGMKLELKAPGTEIDAPKQVFVGAGTK